MGFRYGMDGGVIPKMTPLVTCRVLPSPPDLRIP